MSLFKKKQEVKYNFTRELEKLIGSAGLADLAYVKGETANSKEEVFPTQFINRPSTEAYMYPSQVHDNVIYFLNTYGQTFARFAHTLLVNCEYVQPICADCIAALQTIAESEDFYVKTNYDSDGLLQKVVAKQIDKQGMVEYKVEQTESEVVVTKKISGYNQEDVFISMSYNFNEKKQTVFYEKKNNNKNLLKPVGSVLYKDVFYYNDLGFEIKHEAEKLVKSEKKETLQKRDVVRAIDVVYKKMHVFVKETLQTNVSSTLEKTYTYGTTEDMGVNISRCATQVCSQDLYTAAENMYASNSGCLLKNIADSQEFNELIQNIESNAALNK